MKIRAIAASLIALAIAGCDGSIRCDGNVLDESGEPIPNAHVWIEYPDSAKYPIEYWTAADGNFHLFNLLAPGYYKLPLTVAANGFRPARVDLPTLTGNRVVVRLVLTSSGNSSTVLLK